MPRSPQCLCQEAQARFLLLLVISPLITGLRAHLPCLSPSRFGAWLPGKRQATESSCSHHCSPVCARGRPVTHHYNGSGLKSKLKFASRAVSGVHLWIVFSSQYSSPGERVNSTKNVSAVSLQYKFCTKAMLQSLNSVSACHAHGNQKVAWS